MREVKITRCLPLYRRNAVVKKDIERRKKLGKKMRNIEKANKD